MISSKTIWTISFSLFFAVVGLTVNGQNLANIGQGEAVSVSGGINANQVFYTANGLEDRRDPYNYFLSGNINLSLYGWSVPFSFTYSNQNTSFQQPFNQYGLSPTYKWVTAHLGYRSMTFSKYTLNGHLFLGGGVDLTPWNKVKVSAMYGRLQKPVELDTTASYNVPAYKRMGGGVKVTLGGEDHKVDLIVFRAADEEESLTQDPAIAEVYPEENVVLGLGFSTKILPNLMFKGEFASSAITEDMRAEQTEANNVFDKLPGFQPKTSSSYYNAMNGALQYAFMNSTIGVAYERVDPGYRTLGAYYFNNNLENIALTHTSRWLDKKLNLNVRGGLQRNNLNKTELNSMNRLSGSAMISYQVTPRLMTNFNYSNFSTIVNFRTPEELLNQVTPYDNLDTLNYRQIAQNSNVGVNYVLGENKERRQNLNFNFAYQQTNDEQGGTQTGTGTKFYNANAAYSMNIQPQGLTVSVSGNMNLSQSANGDNMIFGPGLSGRKTLMQGKMSLMASLAYNNSRVVGQEANSVTNLRVGATYALLEKHQFNLNMTAIDRYSPTNEQLARYREFVAELGYSYNFSVR